jgi:hypothetical protein
MPDRLRFFPIWVSFSQIVAILAAMFAVWRTEGKRPWLRVERVVVLIFCIVMGIATLGGLAELLKEIVTGSTEIDGLYLLTSSIMLWVTNVIIFSLLYWQIDLGGPEARLQHRGQPPDWLFTQENLPENMMPDWRPG